MFPSFYLLGVLFFYLTGVHGESYCSTVPVNRENNEVSIKSTFRIVQYNVEWLFIDYYASSDCPGKGCTWPNQKEANVHLNYVANVINELQPDIINLCEIEGCDELTILKNDTITNKGIYTPYVIKGQDSSTGQNVGMLTTIDPLVNLYRSDERVNYPIPGSMCGYTGEPGNSGVSKHYITEFNLGELHIAMIGAHLLAFPTDSGRCVEREAQAQVLQNIISGYINKGVEVIMLGDFNDFDGEVIDANNNKPISQVLNILKGGAGIMAGKYQLFNIAEKIEKVNRYTDWWDENKNCNSTSNEFSMIDHILVTPLIRDKIVNQFIYTGYPEYCGTYNSDHYPVVIDIQI